MKPTECTTILVGKDATIDGSTMIARSEDGGRTIIPERFDVVMPADQSKHYESVISHQKIDDEDLLLTLFAILVHLTHQVKMEFGLLLVLIQIILL